MAFGKLKNIGIRDLLTEWKLSGILTCIFLLVAYFFELDSLNRVIGVFGLLAIVLEYLAAVLFWVFGFGFVYAWWKKKINFPQFLTAKIVVSFIPIAIPLSLYVALFLSENFIAFSTFLSPTVILWLPLFFLYLYASQPFQSLLLPLGLWEEGIISGPSPLGSLLVAGVYSAGVYILWTFVVYLWIKAAENIFGRK